MKIKIGYTNSTIHGHRTSVNVWELDNNTGKKIKLYRLPAYIGHTGNGAAGLEKLAEKLGLTQEQITVIRTTGGGKN